MKDKWIKILAIESSCDDTSAAVISNGKILSNKTASQDVHRDYGGVVPELASRMHQENIVPVIDRALAEAGISSSELSSIAFTKGPGLLGSLLVGCCFAKAYALSLDLPLISVNHMEAHVLAHFIEDPIPPFPFLCLTVSGGHTQILKINGPLDMTILGETIDDAAGEAFDKIGKYLGLKYPAGPEIDRLAKLGEARFSFTKPRIAHLDFSFSGLKTAVLYFLRDQVRAKATFIEENLHDVCASVQNTIVEILLDKLKMAAEEEQIRHIGIAGGVAANSLLRSRLEQAAQDHNWIVYIPKFEYCTDNAAMVAMAAHFKFKNKIFADQTVSPDARMKILRRTVP